MPKRRDFASLPISADGFGAHRIQIALVKIDRDSLTDGFALEEPLILEWDLNTKTKTNRDVALSIAMKADPTFGRIIVDVELGIEFSRFLSEEGGKLRAGDAQNGKLRERDDRAFAVLKIGILSFISKAKVPTSSFVDDAAAHPSTFVRFQSRLFLVQGRCSIRTTKSAGSVANDQQTGGVELASVIDNFGGWSLRPALFAQINEFALESLRLELGHGLLEFFSREADSRSRSDMLHPRTVFRDIAKRDGTSSHDLYVLKAFLRFP